MLDRRNTDITRMTGFYRLNAVRESGFLSSLSQINGISNFIGISFAHLSPDAYTRQHPY
jgi:hypothetical protein